MRSASARRTALGSCLAALLFLCSTAVPGSAVEIDALYRAQTIVTGQGEANRTAGFEKCLAEVLVKVSGDSRLIGDPAIVALSAKAAEFVEGFHYHDRMSGIPVHDEQGTRDRPYDLTVSFRSEKIDEALKALGRAPWLGARPRIAAFIVVRNGTTNYTLVRDEERGRDLRDALTAAAERSGLTITLPTRASIIMKDSADVQKTLQDIGGDVALVGSLVWNPEQLGWVVDWEFNAGMKVYRWQVRGVSFDEAFRNGLRGAAQVLSGNGEPV